MFSPSLPFQIPSSPSFSPSLCMSFFFFLSHLLLILLFVSYSLNSYVPCLPTSTLLTLCVSSYIAFQFSLCFQLLTHTEYSQDKKSFIRSMLVSHLSEYYYESTLQNSTAIILHHFSRPFHCMVLQDYWYSINFQFHCLTLPKTFTYDTVNNLE